MTFRLPIAVEKVFWRDGQKVKQKDISVEQNHNVQTQAAIINNFFGSGLIPTFPDRTFVFNSETLTPEQAILIAGNTFDGYGIYPHSQPSDSSLGNQLEIELKESNIFGRRSVSVLILGLNFENMLQYERFVFHRNEIQLGTKHFTRVLGFIFNNFKGNANGSRAYGGKITIRESLPMQLSRWSLNSSQNVEPNLFFRDIKLYSLSMGPNITTAIKSVISNLVGPAYSIESLGIKTTGFKTKYLLTNDITTKYGQKFLSNSNNIQKVTLLLGVASDPITGLDWSGDLVISLHSLQTAVACPTDIVPSNAISFLPDPTPLAQMSLDKTDLENMGIVLNDVEQPVDFVFSNTKIANAINSNIEAGKYYVVTIQRIGDASVGDLFTITGNNRNSNAKFTFFNGVGWTDVSSEDMWYEVWSDSFKASDGMGVDIGFGMQIDKTEIDADSGAVIDFCYDSISFSNSGQNQLNHVIAQAIKKQFEQIQSEKTGNPVFAKEIYKPSVSSVGTSTLTQLKTVADPVVLGCGYDGNVKTSTTVLGELPFVHMAVNNKLFIVNPSANLLATNLIGCKIIPNTNKSTFIYRIADAELCVDGYGDLNGDGFIDQTDVDRIIQLAAEPDLLQKIADGTPVNGEVVSILEFLRADINGDGVIDNNDVNEIVDYVNKARSTFTAGSSFRVLILTLEHNIGRNDGYYDYSDTHIRVNPYSSSLIEIGLMNSDQLIYYGNPKPVHLEDDTDFITYPGYTPIEFSITNENDYWKEELVKILSNGRLMPCTFTSMTEEINKSPELGVVNKMFECENRLSSPTCNGGTNTFYIPGNLIIDGQLLKNNEEYYPVDYEVGTIIIEMSELPHTNGVIDVFNNFIKDNGNGFTLIGYPALKFADGTTVKSNAFNLHQLRFQVAIQSYYPNLDGYTSIDGYGIIVDPILGINVLNETGQLQYSVSNLSVDPTTSLLRTKIQISVFLKKAGWYNNPITVSYLQTENLTIDV